MSRREALVLGALAFVVGVGAFAFDLEMPIGIAPSVLYTILILLSLRPAGAGVTWAAAAMATGLSLLGFLVDLAAADPRDVWKGYVNRATATFTFWAIAAIGVAYKRGRERRIREETAWLRAEQLATLGEMAAGLSHELGTPLGALQGRLELLEHRLASGAGDLEEVRKTLRIASGLGERMARLLGAVRNLARDASADPFVQVPVELLVRDALAVAEERLRRAGVRVGVAPFDPALRIPCRETQIGQVLLNLVANAADAVEEAAERWIRIEVTPGPDRIAIAVTDSGAGIPEAIRSQIMLPFVTTKPPGKGTGLGLSVSRAFVEAHGGTLTIDAASPHTRFVVTLPRRR